MRRLTASFVAAVCAFDYRLDLLLLLVLHDILKSPNQAGFDPGRVIRLGGHGERTFFHSAVGGISDCNSLSAYVWKYIVTVR